MSNKPYYPIIVGICSSQVHHARRQTIRETWMNRIPADSNNRIKPLFFIGQGNAPAESADVVKLNIDDSYIALPGKVRAFFRHALDNYRFDYLFKCDDDTYVDTSRLPELTKPDVDLLGNSWIATSGQASGGAGYILTHRCVQALVDDVQYKPFGNEDVIVSRRARALGMRILATTRLIYHPWQYPGTDNNIVTSHWLDETGMRCIDTIRHNSPARQCRASHRYWDDNLEFYEEGTFRRSHNGDYGTWHIDADQTLKLNWQAWGLEKLSWNGTDYLKPAIPFTVACHGTPLQNATH